MTRKNKRSENPIGVGLTARQMKRRKPIGLEHLIDIEPLTENQKLLFKYYDEGKNIFAHGVPGSGKTFLASVALPIFATDPRYHKGKDIIYSAPTGAMIKSLIWEPLKRSCIEYFGLVDGKHINNSELTIKFPVLNNVRIYED